VTAANNPVLADALTLAIDGFYVFPAPHNTKKSYKSKKYSPESKRWGATRNADVLQTYWAEHPDANLGIPTGIDNGFYVVETDTPEGHDVDGAASLAAIIAQHGPLPDTRQSISPSGSIHYWFLYPTDGEIRNSASAIGPGIDVRGEGGMVLAPPSIKPGKGAYRWLNDLPIAAAPEWLNQLARDASKKKPKHEISDQPPVVIPPPPPRASRAETALHNECHKVAFAPAGTRNHQLNASSFQLGKFVGAGELDEQRAIQTMVDASKANGSFDEDEDECAETINSGLTAGKNNPVDTVHSMFGAAVAALAKGETSPPPVPEQAPTQQLIDPATTPVPGGPNVAAAEPEEEERLTQVELYEFVAYAEMHSYIHIPTRRMWPLASINSMLDAVPNGTREVENPKTGHMETKPKYMRPSEWLDKFRAVASVTWAPGHELVMRDTIAAEGGLIHAPGRSTFNEYMPPTIEPKEGDARPWLDHVRRVFPDEAEHLISFFAHRVQRPEEKINHGIVLGGAQGVGKDTILAPVVRAIGPWNCKEINPDQLLGQFNPFNKSVILRINEARNLGDQTRNDFYEKTKTLTAAPPEMLITNEKHMKQHHVVNVCAPIVTTNHLDGLYLPPDDRRWFVAWSPLHREDFDAGYWNALYAWFANGGNEIVAWYLANRDLSDFDAKRPPTKTAAWSRMVNMSRASEDSELSDTLDRMGNPDAVTIAAVRFRAEPELSDYLGDKRNSRNLYRRFEACGYVAVDNPDSKEGRWRVSGKKQIVYVKDTLTTRDRLAAARRLEMPTPHVMPPPPYR
jgi:Bifunctional DNA primase/polymerase, N-terminal/Family of unknown function (DUF5906)